MEKIEPRGVVLLGVVMNASCFGFMLDPIDLDVHVFEQGRRCLAGANRGKLVDHVIDAFFHRHLRLQKNVICAHIGECLLCWSIIANQSSDIPSQHGVAQDSRLVHVEHNDRDFVVHAETEAVESMI